MSVKISKDRVEDVLASMRALASQHVLVGFPETTASREGDDLNNPTLAYIHEYGAPEANIPERPFLIPGVESALPEITTLMKMGVKDALSGKDTATRTLRQVGSVAKGAVQRKIIVGPFIPNAPETVRRKSRTARRGAQGSAAPLNDTGALRLAVDFVIEDKE